VTHGRIIVDLFAGGGGASEGIRLALGRDPDVAVNHDEIALAVHMANHPGTWHLRQDVWQVPPRWATKRRSVALLWASPDCTHFSKAKGGAPRRERKRRDLAWVVEKWARDVRPLVIVLENVEEFKTWGPLDSSGRIIASQSGTTFCAFVRRLRRLGYAVEWRELRACDYGAPTIRKRLFLIARCDGLPIVWPEPTHGPSRPLPYRTAAECIDWSIPCPSIFERKRPLAENTLRRIAAGVKRYVIDAAAPFIVTYHGSKGEEFRGQGLGSPLATQTTENRHALVVPYIHRDFSQSVGSPVESPIGTITAGGGGHAALVSAFLAQHNGGFYDGPGRAVDAPISTIMGRGTNQQIVTSNLLKLRGTCRDGQTITEPAPTVTSGGTHIGEVRAFLLKYYGTDQDPGINEPMHTLTTKDRIGVVTVTIAGVPYAIVDIGMRMLQPRELFRAQGFGDGYRIDIKYGGRQITKTDQVRLCGNSVCPPIAAALVRANIFVEQADERMEAAL
jgi:DNA (cytosine-5)-methyltransferase 1